MATNTYYFLLIAAIIALITYVLWKQYQSGLVPATKSTYVVGEFFVPGNQWGGTKDSSDRQLVTLKGVICNQGTLNSPKVNVYWKDVYTENKYHLSRYNQEHLPSAILKFDGWRDWGAYYLGNCFTNPVVYDSEYEPTEGPGPDPTFNSNIISQDITSAMLTKINEDWQPNW